MCNKNYFSAFGPLQKLHQEIVVRICVRQRNLGEFLLLSGNRCHSVMKYRAVCICCFRGSVLKTASSKNIVCVKNSSFIHRPDSVMVTDIAMGANGVGFDYRASQIGQTEPNVSPPLRCFFELCCSSAKLRRWTPPLVIRIGRYTMSSIFQPFASPILWRSIRGGVQF